MQCRQAQYIIFSELTVSLSFNSLKQNGGVTMRKLLLMLGIVSTLIFITACSEEGKETTEAKSDKKSELVVYTNQISGDREEVAKSLVEEQNFNFEVVFVQAGGGEMKDRLIAEKNNPLADVVLGGSPLEHLALAENNILAPFTPTWAENVDPSLVGSENNYWPWAIDTVHYTYNKNLVGGNNQPPVPHDWPDLTKPEFKDQYYIFEPSGTTGAVLFASMLVRYQDKNGEHGVSEEGWKLVEDIYANAVNPAPQDWQEALKEDVTGGFIWGGGVISVARDKNIELDIMEPSVGTPFLPALVGKIHTGNEEKMENAEEFINWWGSADVQATWGEKTGQAPANKEALEKIGGEIQALLDRLETQELDWNYIYEHMDAWREKMALEYAQ